MRKARKQNRVIRETRVAVIGDRVYVYPFLKGI